MNKTLKIILFVLVILLGILMFVYGGYDDSPGGQLLGLVGVIIGTRGIVKNKKEIPNQN
jgi:drug/metabolite transporter (DMT)-like permease